MTTRNKNIRFMENNFAELISASITKSSELTAFPFSNAINKFRSLVWKPSGLFEITSSNCTLYINDGTNKTVTITTGNYTTPDLLAAEIQTKLNASSANWTVQYDTLTGDYRFKISNTGSVTLRLSQTSNAIWNTIGYTTSADIVSTSFFATEQRNHTSEYCIFDMGYSAEILFFSVISPLDEVFSISNSATITLEASNLNQWSSPPLSITLTRNDFGIYQFLDHITDTKYRFWRFKIVDKYNPRGPEGISIGHIYIGDYITLDSRSVKKEFSKKVVDNSEQVQSENGTLYFNRKPKYTSFSSLVIPYIPRSDKDTLEQMFFNLGKTTPFFISLDPTLMISDELSEFTKYVVFTEEPNFQHVFSDKFDMTLQLKELL